MPEKLMPSDSRYQAMNLVAETIAVLTNPTMHLLGYAEGKSKETKARTKLINDFRLEQARQAAKTAQQILIDEP